MASVLHHSLHAFVFAVSLVVLLFTASALAYIPAQATNDTIVAENASTNLTDGSRVKLQWYPGGSYEGRVARVLAGSDSSSSGVSKVSTSLETAVQVESSPSVAD
ncbi:hypothetical protein C8Q74DRAFT_983448 [Fomes fomentarius]|nr:hypothetical protein C8Q74DRAFT_983448 [Fomes fomentarius]